MQEKFLFQLLNCKLLHQKLQILLIFGNLIMYLYMHDMHLRKLTLDNFVAQKQATKKMQVLLNFGEKIMNLYDQDSFFFPFANEVC